MAKTVKPVASDEDVITVEAVEIIPKKNEAQALALVDPFNTMLEQLKEKYGSVEITDKASLEYAQGGISTMTKLRNQVEKRRLEIFRPVLELQKNVKAKVDQFVLDVKEIEQPIRDKINAEELRLQEQARAEHIRRVNALQESGWTLVGQFYTCGVHRILFDQIDTADDEQLGKWVEIGQQELARVAAEEAARRLREAEIAAREEALRQQEAEMEEFRRWKAAQAAAQPVVQANNVPDGETRTTGYVAPVPTPAPASTAPTAGAPLNLWGGEQAPAMNINAPAPSAGSLGMTGTSGAPSPAGIQVGTVVSQTSEAGEYNGPTPQSLQELAQLRGKSMSYLMSSPEFKCYWNMAIDNVLLRFTNESHTKAEWVEIFNNLRK